LNTHQTRHDTTIDATPDTVYAIVADATRWPLYFAPNLHVDREDLGASAERLHIWALANGEIKSWKSRRDLDAARRTIVFRQEKSAPPVVSMVGTWTVTGAGGGTRLILDHEFAAEDEAGVAWVKRATNDNSATELANIKALAERWTERNRLTTTFEDAMLIDAPLQAVYDFLYRADEWPKRLPHVSRLDLIEDEPNVQRMTMETRGADGSTHTTESVRICFPHTRIPYKQVIPPALMAAHTGEWTLRTTAEGVLATSRHSVVVEERAITAVLGPDATGASAVAFARTALSTNSLATLKLAKEFTEAGSGR
jgi:aromatase/bifunctional cyclase/aromatase